MALCMVIRVLRNRLQGTKLTIDPCSEREIDVVVSKECKVEFLVIRRFDVINDLGYGLK